jgi:hypothetical protein
MEIPTRHHWESDAARSDDVCEFGELAAKYGLTYGTPASTGKVAGPVGQRPVHRGSLSRSCSDDGSTGGVLTSSWPLVWAGWWPLVSSACWPLAVILPSTAVWFPPHSWWAVLARRAYRTATARGARHLRGLRDGDDGVGWQRPAAPPPESADRGCRLSGDQTSMPVLPAEPVHAPADERPPQTRRRQLDPLARPAGNLSTRLSAAPRNLVEVFHPECAFGAQPTWASALPAPQRYGAVTRVACRATVEWSPDRPPQQPQLGLQPLRAYQNHRRENPRHRENRYSTV